MNLREVGLVVDHSHQTEVVDSPGGKCIHGVYIPANQTNLNQADFCTVCESYRKGSK